MRATVIIPTFDHGKLIRFALDSVLTQTHQDFEVFVIGDGAPQETEDILAEYQQKDSRFRFFKHPKGPRHGEIYRHQALQEACGDFVCYLCDDDLFLPNHLEVIAQGLKTADFVHTLPFNIKDSGEIYFYLIDLAQDFYTALLLNGVNRIPLSAGAHTMELYRRLPYGWRTTPTGTFTDLYMWQQILNVPGIKAQSLDTLTVLHFASAGREHMIFTERFTEIETYSQQMLDNNWLKQFSEKVQKARNQAAIRCEVEHMKQLTELTQNYQALNVEKEVLAGKFLSLQVSSSKVETDKERHIQNITAALNNSLAETVQANMTLSRIQNSRAYRLLRRFID